MFRKIQKKPKHLNMEYKYLINIMANEIPEELPKEIQEKLKAIKTKLEKFKKKVIEKYKPYIIGIALLPPDKENKEKINILVLDDDTDAPIEAKAALKEGVSKGIDEIAKSIDKNLNPELILLSELWQDCYDGKYEPLQMIAMGAPIHDTGMLQAIKIAEIHKTMVVKKFEKYIVSYVLAGSLVQGKATKDSDIDVFVVVDDTDVKRMTRAELKDKLRAIIIQMAYEAGELTGIKNKLNVQVYILTEFWDSVKEANPIIFTFLRDGVPFYDRGVFMPWKLLLKMGKIKPSQEAIDMYMSGGEEMLKRVRYKLNDIGSEDIFYAILTPSQAALMLYGVPPPTPKETSGLMREVFVKKEGMLEEKDVKILENVIKVRKDIEHGIKKEISGKELDSLLKNAEEYLKKIQKVFSQLQRRKEKEDLVRIYDNIKTVVRDVLKTEGLERIPEEELVSKFKEEIISKGKLPARYGRLLNQILKTEKEKLNKTEIEKLRKNSNDLIRTLVEYMQRKYTREVEKTRIRVKYDNKQGEIILLEKEAFIIKDLDKEKEVDKAKFKPDGSLGEIEKSSLEEMEKTIAAMKGAKKVAITDSFFNSLKKIFGKKVEIVL